MDEMFLKQSIEAILFVAGQPISIKRLKEIFDGDADNKEVENALNSLVVEWKERSGSLEIIETGGGWRFRTKPEFSEYIKRAFAPRPRSLTSASLETVAIIAYRQPITRPEIEKLRGVDCGGVLKTLMEKNIIKMVGRKEEPGSPMLYATTPEFLELFGINSTSDLPPLKDVEEMREEFVSRSNDVDDDLSSFIATEQNIAKGDFLEDEDALNELEGRLKEVKKLERDIFPNEKENSEKPIEGQNENAEQAESKENTGEVVETGEVNC